MQAAYKAAVEQWIAAIREEETLASGNHSEAEIDTWGAAGFREEDARTKAKEAKKTNTNLIRKAGRQEKTKKRQKARTIRRYLISPYLLLPAFLLSLFNFFFVFLAAWRLGG